MVNLGERVEIAERAFAVIVGELVGDHERALRCLIDLIVEGNVIRMARGCEGLRVLDREVDPLSGSQLSTRPHVGVTHWTGYILATGQRTHI
jgi:hypothetical protein